MSTSIATQVVPTAMTGRSTSTRPALHTHEHTHEDGHHEHEHKCCQ